MQIQLILCIISFYCFFIYKLRQEVDHSQSKLHYKVQKKRKKIINTTNKNDNTLETTKKKKKKKKKRKCKSRIGKDIDKKSTTHTIEQAVQWPTSVALNKHSLKGLRCADIINRLREIQVVIKKIFFKVRY